MFDAGEVELALMELKMMTAVYQVLFGAWGTNPTTAFPGSQLTL